MEHHEQDGQIPPMQLRMAVTAERIRDLPVTIVPAQYSVRTYRPGDEAAWSTLLSVDFEDWTVSRVEAFLDEQSERRKTSYVAVKGDEIVSATFGSHWTDVANVGQLDYVITHPNHQSRGLGRVVCTAVMRALVALGYPKIVLFTDDWRLPAIYLYLSLGFEPEMMREDMPARWDAILKKLEERDA